MNSFNQIHRNYQSLICLYMLLVIMTNGYIMAFGLIRVRNIKITILAFFQILLFALIILGLSTYMHKINFNLEADPYSDKLALTAVWIYLCLLVLASFVATKTLIRLNVHKRNTLSKSSIKEGLDNLDMALSISLPNGRPILVNKEMDRLSYMINKKELNNTNAFWTSLIVLSQKADNRPWRQVDRPNFTTDDRRVWSFSKRILDIDGYKLIELIGVDTSQLNAFRQELEENNHMLDGLSKRLRQYSIDVIEIKGQEERLASKMRIHDELGYALLFIRQYLRGEKEIHKDFDKNIEGILEIWKRNIGVLKEGLVSNQIRPFDSFISHGIKIGVEVILRGELPREDKIQRLIILVGREALTNSVRHGFAKNLYIDIKDKIHFYEIDFTNDGRKPKLKIIEGGGLKSIRNKVEKHGGKMSLYHEPVFLLRISLDKKGETNG